MPIPFIVAGAALLGAAVAGGIVGEMLSDDDEPKMKTSPTDADYPPRIKEKIDESQVPADVLEMLEKNPQNTYRSANGISYCYSAGNFFRF